jgi:nitrogen regulatory protein PII
MKAFPTTTYLTVHGYGYQSIQHPGMDLRDYFAAKAMQSILVNIECGPNDVKDVVESAYILADAMMEERKK